MLAPILLFWTGYTFKESRYWANEEKFSERNFNRSPSCKSARVYATSFYTSGRRIPTSLASYLSEKQCFDAFTTNYSRVESIVFKSFVIYYEDFGSLEIKIQKLNDLAKQNFFPHVVLADLFIKNARYTEAQYHIFQAVEPLKGRTLIEMYDNEVLKDVVSYCERINDEECSSILGGLVRKRILPYL